MTIKQLKKLIKGLPDNLNIVMMVDEEIFKPVCALNSQIVDLEDEETNETQKIIVLCPCVCGEEDCEIEQGEINSQPELN